MGFNSIDFGGFLKGLPKSKLSINELIELSQKDFFKVSMRLRQSNLGDFSYKGFNYSFHRDSDKKLVVYVNLYFYHKGASFDFSKDKNGKIKKGKRKKRETYLLVVKFPYTLKIKNMKRLYDVPIQLFSSDPSFKYFFTYALNKMGAVVTDQKILVNWLGESLTKPPKKTNPDLKLQLTKHFFKFFKFISNNKPKQYLDKKYLLKKDVHIVNKVK